MVLDLEISWILGYLSRIQLQEVQRAQRTQVQTGNLHLKLVNMIWLFIFNAHHKDMFQKETRL